jgi:hypothetical protein
VNDIIRHLFLKTLGWEWLAYEISTGVTLDSRSNMLGQMLGVPILSRGGPKKGTSVSVFFKLGREDYTYLSQHADMAKQSIKSRNKQLRRRLEGLKSKSYSYGKLDDIDLLLIIRNRVKDDYYTYSSTDRVSSWRIDQIVSRPSCRDISSNI